MPYSREIVERARQTLSERRAEAEMENMMRTEEIKERFPEIYQKEMSVRGTFFRLIQQSLSGNIDDDAMLESIDKERTESIDFVRKSLRANGYSEDYLDTPYYCKKCCDTGSIDGVNCECFKALLKKYAAEQVTLGGYSRLRSFDEARGDIYKSADVAAYMGKIINFLRRYCDSFEKTPENRSMLFYGNTGTGKTFLSACVANELTQKGFAVSFGTAYELFKSVEDQRFKNAEGDTEGTLVNCDMLIIDDLGSEFRTSYTESVLYNILNTRLDRGRPTIVSTNLSLDELKKRYNERISSRLTGIFTPVNFKGSDVRLDMQMMNGK